MFKLTPASTLIVLHSFSIDNGDGRWAGLVRDGKGNLYGTTYLGGANDRGTIFRIDPCGE